MEREPAGGVMPARQLRMFPIPTRAKARLLELLPDVTVDFDRVPPVGHYVAKLQVPAAEDLVAREWAQRVSPQHYVRTTAGKDALRLYEQTQLPPGVVVVLGARGFVVVLGGKELGSLSRTGASRGCTARWYAHVEDDSLLESFPNRTAAARAVCKLHGLGLPGEK